MKPENIIKFSELSNKPDGTVFRKIIQCNKEKQLKSGRILKWDCYDVTMICIKGGNLCKIDWDYFGGKITIKPIQFLTSDVDYFCEFEQTDLNGILDGFDKFFYDSREARCNDEHEISELNSEWREENVEYLKFLLKIK